MCIDFSSDVVAIGICATQTAIDAVEDQLITSLSVISVVIWSSCPIKIGILFSIVLLADNEMALSIACGDK